ncbi:MAG: beta-lactamase family protein [Alphaproteobacteria bacterium]|nr:beta-lactamase family protein [Alphaproteobacteria bacterium]
MNGAIAIAKDHLVFYAKGFGFADNSAVPTQLCNENTQFFIASITKQFTAAALLHVLRRKHQNIDELSAALHRSLSLHLPENDPLWDGDTPEWVNRVTLHHLLTHTSGLVSYTAVESFENNSNSPISTINLAKTFKNEPLKFIPGEKFEYCDSGYFLLSEIVTRLSGLSLDQYLTEHFFKYLGMMNTFLPDEDNGKIMKDLGCYPNLARGYEKDINLGSQPKEITTYFHNSFLSGAGGIISTASDVLIWNYSLHNNKILTPEVTALMLTGHVRINEYEPHHFYCYGITRNIQEDKLVFQHDGGIPGFSTTLAYCSQNQLSFVAFQNLEVPRHIKAEIYNLGKEAQEIHKDLKLININKFENAVKETISSKIPDAYETYLKTQPMHLIDIFKH